jgi:hypothetical protein
MLWMFGNESNVEPGDTVDNICPSCHLIKPCVEVVSTSSFSVWLIKLSENKKLKGYVCQECGNFFEDQGKIDSSLVLKITEKLAEEANEAAAIAKNNTLSYETRMKQLQIAHDKFDELALFAKKYHFYDSLNTAEFKHDLELIEEITKKGE